MVMCVKEPTPRTAVPAGVRPESPGYGDGGPVFVPSRKPSRLARTLLTGAGEGGRVTAYDDLWYAGRPRS